MPWCPRTCGFHTLNAQPTPHPQNLGQGQRGRGCVRLYATTPAGRLLLSARAPPLSGGL